MEANTLALESAKQEHARLSEQYENNRIEAEILKKEAEKLDDEIKAVTILHEKIKNNKEERKQIEKDLDACYFQINQNSLS
jgi:Cu/Ag efflux protein CusF